MADNEQFSLRPGINNPDLWYPERPSQADWKKLRRVVLTRDKDTCQYCGHVASKYMNIHHIDETGENSPNNLITCCVACHALLHMGRNLSIGTIEIWRTELPQVEIVRKTRDGVRSGKTLEDINAEIPKERGPYEPDSIDYANSLIKRIGENSRAALEEPLSAIFVDLKRWQIE